MTRYCSDCGEEFEAQGTWQRLCWPCWRAQKDTKGYDRGYDDGFMRGYSVGYNEGASSPDRRTFTNTKLDADTLRHLIQLCHPDRHPPERAGMANHVTATLLGLLNRERNAA